MVLLHLLLAENERAFFYNFFTATIASNLFDSLVLFEEKKFNIMMHNQRRSQWHTWGVRGVRTHPPQNVKFSFLNGKCSVFAHYSVLKS